MGTQEIRQRARRQALETAARQRKARAARERRVRDLVTLVLTAIGERDQAVTEAERRAGVALQQMTLGEGLTLAQAVEWCGDELTVREATRLRRLATETSTDATIEDGVGTALDRQPRDELDGSAAVTQALDGVLGTRI